MGRRGPCEWLIGRGHFERLVGWEGDGYVRGLIGLVVGKT